MGAAVPELDLLTGYFSTFAPRMSPHATPSRQPRLRSSIVVRPRGAPTLATGLGSRYLRTARGQLRADPGHRMGFVEQVQSILGQCGKQFSGPIKKWVDGRLKEMVQAGRKEGRGTNLDRQRLRHPKG